MTLHTISVHALSTLQSLGKRLQGRLVSRPIAAAIVLAGSGLIAGGAMNAATVNQLHGQVASQEQALDATRRDAQREVNALAARLGELQAQANRLNALGDRLTRIAKLGDGEFDFDKPVAVGGADASHDMPARELVGGLDEVNAQFGSAGRQLSVLEALLFDQELERNAMPSRSPVANSYITSGFGGRADPFGGGGQFHKGIDFDARTGDPVMTVADGVVSYSGVRSGYGNVVEVDHGNGFVTRYAHNSRNTVKVGDLVRVGHEIAKAGSTGRSTGAHVHFEVWENGRVHNPRKFLGEIGRQ
ncbi:MAG TPA: peptidoglycan DD-metalloendopeptidase family protein [Gammaproteobacteria bacterium]|nr:peptidoglycan DD-metalloendopeptidase family protein [Luteimonas sp.]HRO27450.1 peptidoglycan DD-metalloendopeptidase family protein [Luteimonas sp.]HRP35934.1 peptidoglycan DD-metalloendopeptidase family protein [Gammaproteobacteria bacterium]HRP71905.1 peptidoglycan DD-metalloendopeptidase family protein [Luteimonas sp.]